MFLNYKINTGFANKKIKRVFYTHQNNISFVVFMSNALMPYFKL